MWRDGATPPHGHKSSTRRAESPIREKETDLRIYIGNLAYETREEELRSEFEVYGEVQEVTVVRDRDTGRSRGFGFVEMPTGLTVFEIGADYVLGLARGEMDVESVQLWPLTRG